MYLGTGLTSDVLGGFFLGLATGAAVHVLFGAPSGRPSARQIQTALGDLGLDVTGLERSGEQYPGATIMDGSLGVGCSGPRRSPSGAISETASSRRSSGTASCTRIRAFRCSGAGSRPSSTSPTRRCWPTTRGVSAPKVLKTGSAGQDIALLVTDVPTGRPFSELGDDLTDATLAAAWTALDQLHGAGITHGASPRIASWSQSGGGVGFVDLGSAEVTADEYRRNRDVAALLVATSLLVDTPQPDPSGDGDATPDGDAAPVATSRAIGAAVASLGKERVGAAVPLIQPAALPAGDGRGIKHFAKTAEDAPPGHGVGGRGRGSGGAQDQAAEPGQHRDARRRAPRAGDRDPEPQGHQLGIRAERVRERDVGLGGARALPVPARPDLMGRRRCSAA